MFIGVTTASSFQACENSLSTFVIPSNDGIHALGYEPSGG